MLPQLITRRITSSIHLIYSYIRQLAEKIKLAIVFAEDVVASGGYFIACAGDEIYALAP